MHMHIIYYYHKICTTYLLVGQMKTTRKLEIYYQTYHLLVIIDNFTVDT